VCILTRNSRTVFHKHSGIRGPHTKSNSAKPTANVSELVGFLDKTRVNIEGWNV